MGRTRTFDKDEALARAMELFWQRGYEGTSMQALVDYMGLNRSSLYDTFGDKRALYHASLDRYARHRAMGVIRLMEQDLPIREAFQRLFKGFVDTAIQFTDRRGCFLVNAAIDQVPHDPKTADTVRQNNDAILKAFQEALVRAQGRGELDGSLNPHHLAHYFMNAFNGLRVTVKTTPDRAILYDIVTTTLAVLD